MDEVILNFIKSDEFKKVNAKTLCEKAGISYHTLAAYRSGRCGLPKRYLALIEKQLKKDAIIWAYLKTLENV